MAGHLPPGPFVPPVPPNISQLAGPPFLGIYLNGCLYGVLVLQYYSYCLNFGNDLKWLRYIVHTQFVLQTAQTVMLLADGFHWFVFGYGNIAKLGEFFLSWLDAPVIGSVIALITQGVYCWRIYHISKWKIPTFTIALFGCGQAAGGIGLGIISYRAGTISHGDPGFQPVLILWTVCSAVADVLIAVSMTYLLLSAAGSLRKRTPVVTRLIRLIIETNTATAVVAIVVLLTTILPPIAPPAASYFLCPGFVLGKLYSNSFIAMLNNRQSGTGGSSRGGSDGSDDYQSSSAPDRGNASQTRRMTHFTVSGIKGDNIYTETSVDIELARPVYRRMGS